MPSLRQLVSVVVEEKRHQIQRAYQSQTLVTEERSIDVFGQIFNGPGLAVCRLCTEVNRLESKTWGKID